MKNLENFKRSVKVGEKFLFKMKFVHMINSKDAAVWT